MASERYTSNHPRMRAAIVELQHLILDRYPDARFSVDEGRDPTGVYVTATVDVADTDEVVDLFIDRLVDLHVEEGLPLHVVPVRPVERVAAMLRDRQARPRAEALPLG